MNRIFSFATLFVLTTLFATASFAAYLPEPDDAERIEIKKRFDEWYAKTNAEFEVTWQGILDAEAAAEPAYAKGVELAEAGKMKPAIKSFLKARSTLFNAPTAEFIQVDKGLSLKIALALAEIYEKQEDEARLKREISIMRVGRPWMSKEEEHKVFLRKVLHELQEVYRIEENKTGKRMKSAQRRELLRVMRYLAVYLGERYFEDGSKLKDDWEAAVDAAKKSQVTESYEDFGAEGDLTLHQPLSPARAFKKDQNIFALNLKVTKVSGKYVIFDYKMARDDAFDCQNVGKPLKVTGRGRFVYKQKCKYKKVKGGHRLYLTPPKGLKLRKGDLVSLYALVSRTQKDNVYLKTPAVLHSSRKGKAQWLLGVKTKKPSYIDDDQSYKVQFVDDANAPPSGK